MAVARAGELEVARPARHLSAGLFDLEGVLTDSGVLHAWAWGEVFDEFLLRLTEKAGWHFIPFDRSADYSDYIDGRPRLEGVHAFLGSRGVRLPEGRVDDPAEADTAHVWGAKTLFTTRDHPDLQAEPSAEAPRG